MTAAEVIDQIKALNPQERAKVPDHLLRTESSQSDACLDDNEFERAAGRVMARRADLLRKLAR